MMVPLKDVVFMYSEAAKQSDSTFLRLWRTAFRGFVQMGLNSFWSVRTISIVVNPNATATLPPDFIQWVKIGNFNNLGELQILDVNNNLTTFKGTSSNRISQIASEVGLVSIQLTTSPFFGVASLGSTDAPYLQQDFGLGSRLLTVGQCKVDTDNNVILLNTDFPYPHIILEYVSSPIQNDDYQIPIQFQEAMIAWLGWQDVQYTPALNKGSAGARSQAAQNFAHQVRLARKMYKPVRIEEIALEQIKQQSYSVKG